MKQELLSQDVALFNLGHTSFQLCLPFFSQWELISSVQRAAFHWGSETLLTFFFVFFFQSKKGVTLDKLLSQLLQLVRNLIRVPGANPERFCASWAGKSVARTYVLCRVMVQQRCTAAGMSLIGARLEDRLIIYLSKLHLHTHLTQSYFCLFTYLATILSESVVLKKKNSGEKNVSALCDVIKATKG